MTHARITRAIGALVIASAAIATPALAQSIDQAPSIRVSYADLDIHQPDGAGILLARIDVAADRACGGAPDLRLLAQRAAFDRCRREAISRAVAGVNEPLVTAAAAKAGPVIRIAHR
jgi:UrcA family protein